MYKIYPEIFAKPPGRALKILLAMKFLIIFMTISVMQAGAVSLAQKITLNEKNARIETVFEEIRTQSGYDFLVTDMVLKNAQPVTIKVQNMELAAVLDKIFSDQPLQYQISDKAVLVKNKERSIIDYVKSVFTAIDVTGRVLDDQGTPVAGATIQIKNASRVTTTDNYGFFMLKNVEPKSVILISVIGFDRKEIVANTTSLGEIRLTKATSKLDEVQVIAYGTTTQRYNVGSAYKVTSDEISSQPVTNPLAALEGRVPGLLVTSISGNPGAAYQIQIRGQNTLGASVSKPFPDNPYFIVDGIPFAPQNTSINRLQTVSNSLTQQAISGLSPFELIDPANIESIEVLKDADATSIYGARGANGVVLITTKQGKSGKIQLTGNINSGVSVITRTVPILGTQEYLQMRRDAFKADNLTPSATPGATGFAPDLTLYDSNRYTNFMQDFYGKNATMLNANLSLSGGDFLNTYYVSMNYGKQTYLFPGDFTTNNIDGMLKLHHNSLNRKFNLDVSAQYAFNVNNAPGSPSVLSAFTLAPNFPELLGADGSLRWDYNGLNFSALTSSGLNPYAYLKQTNRIGTSMFATSMLIGYEFLPGLKFKTNLGFNNQLINEYSKYPVVAQNPAFFPTSSANKSYNSFYTWNIEPQLSYDKQFGKEKISVLLGGTLQKNENGYLQATGFNYSNDLLMGTIGAAATTSTFDGTSTYKYSAAFGRINFVHDGRYILSFTGRADGSSRFAPGRAWGRFASAAGGWIFTEEKFFQKLNNVLSFGKLRASYGLTGNDNVGNYLYTSNWSRVSAALLYNGSVGYIAQNLPNADFGWSTTKKLETGLELGFLKDRILVNAAWYRNRSGNQLVQYQLPSQTGFSNVTQNFPAVIENTGWELSLSGTPFKGKNFSWKSNFNFSSPRNKLAAFPNIAATSYANIYVVGLPVSTMRGYRYAGINTTTGVYQFMTVQGNITSTPSAQTDRTFALGNTDPKFFGGWRNTFSYKNLQLDVFFEFRKQRGLSYSFYQDNATGVMANVPVDALNVWRQAGDNAKYQRLTSQSFGSAATSAFGYYKMSDGVLTDASYIRLRTAGLSYNINPQLLRKFKLAGARVYVNAQNLLTITNYTGTDPETQNYYGIPPLRTIVAGLNLNF